MYSNLSLRIGAMFDTELGAEAYKAVLCTIDRYSMRECIEKGVLVGFSGGADSVMLLCFLIEYRRRLGLDFKILACHINHMLRGDEADRDMLFAKQFAEAVGVEFVSVCVDVAKKAKEKRIGTEEMARIVRYDCFSEIQRERNDLTSIALAHNANDNLETVIFNMMRGSGILGMCGIAPVRDNIIRPILSLSKEQIINTLSQSGIDFVFDSTNDSVEYTRNYIRHEIVPKLERLNPHPESAVFRMTEKLRGDYDYLTGEAEKLLSGVDISSSVDINFLRSLDSSLLSHLLKLYVKKCVGLTLNSKNIEDISRLISKNDFSVSIGDGYSFLCQRGRFLIDCPHPIDEEELFIPLKMGKNALNDYSAVLYFGKNSETFSNVYNFSIHARLTSAIIVGDLYLRFRHDGDAYHYGGMTHKLKKVFNDRNIPSRERERIPILCDSHGIVWVPGLGVRDDVMADKDSENSLEVTLYYTNDAPENKRIYTALMRK